MKWLLTLSGGSVPTSLLTGLQWMSPSKPGKAGIISIGRDPFHSALDGDGSKIRIRDEVTLGVGLVA